MTLLLEGCGLDVSPLMGRTLKTEARGSQWPRKELIKYGVFIRFFKEDSLASTFRQDQWTFFRGLSLFIQSKNPNQCRIFHNKLMREFHTIDDVLQSIISKIERFQHWCDIYESSLINTRNIIVRKYESNHSTSLLAHISHKSSECGIDKGNWGSEVKVKEEERPTDADYQDEKGDGNLPLSYRPVNNIGNATGSDGYGDRRSSMPELCFDEAFAPQWHYGYQTQALMGQLPINQNQHLWLDCHNTFLAYASKLSNLLNRSSIDY